MFSSRSKRILSLLEPNVVNATQNNQQIVQRKTKKRLKKDSTAKELSDLEEDGPEISETQGHDGDHFEEPDQHEAEPLPRQLQKQVREDPADEEYLPEDEEYVPEDEEDGRKTNKRKKTKNNRSCIKRPWSPPFFQGDYQTSRGC